MKQITHLRFIGLGLVIVTALVFARIQDDATYARTSLAPLAAQTALIPQSNLTDTEELVVYAPPVRHFAKKAPKKEIVKIHRIEAADSLYIPEHDSLVESLDHVQTGLASYYGTEFEGQRTASGERFDADSFTAAHPSLPLGSKVKVTNTANGKSIVLRVNDRGPFHGKRIIDVSKGAARKLGMLARGTAMVRLELVRKK